jgi:hypothetical protein
VVGKLVVMALFVVLSRGRRMDFDNANSFARSANATPQLRLPNSKSLQIRLVTGFDPTAPWHAGSAEFLNSKLTRFFGERFGNNLGTKPEFFGLFLGSGPHKGNRIISSLAEACGSRICDENL